MSVPSPPAPSADPPLATRKADHLRIAAGNDALHAHPAGFDRFRLRHRALPGRDLSDVQLATQLLGRQLSAPLIVSAMTGGTADAQLVNERLARAAARHGIGVVLGSGRPLLDDPSLLPTYRSTDRPPLLVANIGAAQLLGAEGPASAQRLVELLDADALSIHLNPLQEAVQPEGEPHFGGMSEAIATTCARLGGTPVVVKEVGFGLCGDDVRELLAAGVTAIDVAGAGGTNWALVEGQRDSRARDVAEAFGDWGTPTADALQHAQAVAPEAELIASGGIANGVEVATALALGARAAGLARQLLLAAQADRADHAVGVLIEQLRIATWLTGAPSCAALNRAHLEVAT